MNKHISYFIEDVGIFGGYPKQDQVNILEKEFKVKYFVNLTCASENLDKYNVSGNSYYFSYPIKDYSYPSDKKLFSSFIVYLSEIITNLKNSEKIYIHCKGGHGRVGIVVASLLCYIKNISVQEALKLTNECHKKREIMKEKWRNIGSPQTYNQKKFVHKLFEPLYFFKYYKNNVLTNGLNNLSKHSIDIPNIGKFSCLDFALVAMCNSTNLKLIEKIKNMKIEDYENLKEINNYSKELNIIKKLLNYKVDQHYDIKNTLLNSGLRKIIYNNTDIFLGNGNINNGINGTNKLGKEWEKIRHNLYVNMVKQYTKSNLK